MRRIVWLGCYAYFLIGLATVAFGALLPEMLREYGRSYSSGGQLVFAQFAGFFFGVLAAPRLSVRLGYRITIWIGLLSLTLTHAALFFQPFWLIVIALAVLNGCGFGMTQTALGTYLLETSKQEAVTMSRLEVAFGIGALFMPVVSGLFIAKFNWAWSFGVVAVLAFVNLLIWSGKSVAAVHPVQPLITRDGSKDAQAEASVKSRYHGMTLAFLIGFVFLYVGIETSLINFLPSLFSQHYAIQSSEASLSVTLFWIAMVTGRIFSGYIADRIRYDRFLFGSSIGAGLCLAVMPAVHHPVAAFGFVLLTGLFLSGIFAILIVYANRIFPGNTKQTTSLLIASGGIGGAVLPLMIGWSMDRWSAASTIGIIAGCSLLLLVCLYKIRAADSVRSGKRGTVKNISV